jgi:hypothetical protein
MTPTVRRGEPESAADRLVELPKQLLVFVEFFLNHLVSVPFRINYTRRGNGWQYLSAENMIFTYVVLQIYNIRTAGEPGLA